MLARARWALWALWTALCCLRAPDGVLGSAPGQADQAATASAHAPASVLEEPDLVPGLGSLRGSQTLSHWRRRPVFQYQAIPYAEPPSGPRRFLVGAKSTPACN